MDLTFSPLAIGGVLVSAIAGAGIFLRRLSRDKLELAKDRAEEDLLTHLAAQRDSAIAEKEKAQKGLDESLAELEAVEQKVRDLSAENNRLSVQVSILTGLVGKLNAALEESKVQLKEVVAEIKKVSSPSP